MGRISKTTGWLLFVVTALCACGNKNKVNTVEIQQDQIRTYDCELFSVSYPDSYFAKENKPSNGHFHTLLIGKDSLDKDMTTIMWEIPNTFPSTVKDFIILFVSREIEDFEKSNTFYDVMRIDSTYTISGYSTYSIASIFVEGEDSVIQSRTGLIIPGRCDMMIIQRAKVKKPMAEVKAMIEIISSIKIKSEQ